MPARPRVIIDCDPGHDDAMAILIAGVHTELLGITTVAGNAPLDATTRNALQCVELMQLDVPVHAGAARPLLVPARHAAEVHGPSGMDGHSLPAPAREVAGRDAVRFIVDTLRREDDVWLVPMGPLTNIALALREAPDIATRMAGISLMGGSASHGNVTAAAEFNLWADPHAAAIVFGCAAPLHMCGLDVTQQFLVDEATVTALRGIGNAAGSFAADLLAFYVRSAQARTGRAGGPLHDPCAVLALTHPQLLRGTHLPVAVETDGSLTRGMTVVDRRPWTPADKANCVVYEHIDHDAAMQVFLDAVASYR